MYATALSWFSFATPSRTKALHEMLLFDPFHAQSSLQIGALNFKLFVVDKMVTTEHTVISYILTKESRH